MTSVAALLSGNDDRFEPVADALRVAVVDHYARRKSRFVGIAALNTLETNSGLVPQRIRSLLVLLHRHTPDLELDGLRVLDAGCGFGALSVFLAFQGAQVTAIDPKRERMEVGEAVAAQFGLRLDWLECSLDELPLPDRSFDLVVVNNVLCYVLSRSERLVSLVHIRRVLRPGGALLMRNPNRTAPRDPFTRLPLVNMFPRRTAQTISRILRRHRSDVTLLTVTAQRRELRRVGFVDVDIRSPRRRVGNPVDRWVASYQHAYATRSPKQVGPTSGTG